MSNYELFYADVEDGLPLLNQYKVDDWIHARNGVVASRLRGGLLTNCNLRVVYLPFPQENVGYRQMDEDYKNLQMIIFHQDTYFGVLDKYQIGNKAQILMSPAIESDDERVDEIVRFARADFDELIGAAPVSVLDNATWKSKAAVIPGIDAKNSPSKGFLTMFWK